MIISNITCCAHCIEVNMARVTVEDCLEKLSNRFELVLAATKRARQLTTGAADPLVDWENDKATVVALREIAESKINPKTLLNHPDPANEFNTHQS